MGRSAFKHATSAPLTAQLLYPSSLVSQMRLSTLDIHNLRNIQRANLQGLSAVNLIHGVNGSGKTSILEAIYSLSLTRSFRSRKTKTVVKDGENEFVVRALLSVIEQDIPIAIRRSLDNRSVVKVNEEKINSFGELAGLLPIQLINPDSFDLLEGGPGYRRHFLDWPMFHVKHSGFFPAWSRYRKALSQRNALLRRGKMPGVEAALEPWTAELAKQGQLLDEIRRQSFESVSPVFFAVCRQLEVSSFEQLDGSGRDPVSIGDFPEVGLEYIPGWDDKSYSNLGCALRESLEADLKQGFTRIGPHRADIKVKVGRVDASERLSRGQIKTVVCALKIAQAKWLKQAHGIESVFLIDDIAAELDKHRRRALIKEVVSVASQLFATSIQSSELDDAWFQGLGIKRFHVEHGVIRPCTLE